MCSCPRARCSSLSSRVRRGPPKRLPSGFRCDCVATDSPNSSRTLPEFPGTFRDECLQALAASSSRTYVRSARTASCGSEARSSTHRNPASPPTCAGGYCTRHSRSFGPCSEAPRGCTSSPTRVSMRSSPLLWNRPLPSRWIRLAARHGPPPIGANVAARRD